MTAESSHRQKMTNLFPIWIISTRMSHKSCHILVCASSWYVYHITKAVQAMKNVPAIVSNNIVVDALTLCALLHCVYDMKAEQINMQCILIQEFLLYESGMGHKTAEATKNICCVKGEDAADHSTVIRWFKKFHFGCKKKKQSGKVR